jgi:hypothetical protein
MPLSSPVFGSSKCPPYFSTTSAPNAANVAPAMPIHPGKLPIIREMVLPTADKVAWAKKIAAA